MPEYLELGRRQFGVGHGGLDAGGVRIRQGPPVFFLQQATLAHELCHKQMVANLGQPRDGTDAIGAVGRANRAAPLLRGTTKLNASHCTRVFLQQPHLADDNLCRTFGLGKEAEHLGVGADDRLGGEVQEHAGVLGNVTGFAIRRVIAEIGPVEFENPGDAGLRQGLQAVKDHRHRGSSKGLCDE